MSDTNCSECNALFPVLAPGESGGSGYAVWPNGARICYACANSKVRQHMRTHDVVTAYLTNDGARVETWSGPELGGLLGEVTQRREGRLFGHRKQSIRVRAFDGSIWYARGADFGMVCTLRRVKSKRGNRA